MVSSIGKIVYSTAKSANPTAIESAFKQAFINKTGQAAKIVDKKMVQSQPIFTSALDYLVKGLEGMTKKIERLKGENGINEKMGREINKIFKNENKAQKIFDKFLDCKGVTELIDDGYGGRIIINSKTFVNKKGETVNTIDEIFKRILKAQKQSKLKVMEIESYHGKGFNGYISEDLKNTLALHDTEVISKTKDAGYTRVNMILEIDGKRIELQVGGSDLLGNKEHILHDIREGKKLNFAKYSAEEKNTAKELIHKYRKISRTEEGKTVYEHYLNSCWKYDKECFDAGKEMKINDMPKIQDAFKSYLNDNPEIKKAYLKYARNTKNGLPTNSTIQIADGKKTLEYNLENLDKARKQMQPILDVRVFTSLP